MKNITAIPTTYRKIKFRSRTEAKWAVYFDAIGIDWQYEPEGFILSDGSTYLPDFYLKNYNWYAEIKPENFVDDHRHHLFAAADGRLMVFKGLPDSPQYLIASSDGYLTKNHKKTPDRLYGIEMVGSARFEHGEFPDIVSFEKFKAAEDEQDNYILSVILRVEAGQPPEFTKFKKLKHISWAKKCAMCGRHTLVPTKINKSICFSCNDVNNFSV